MLSPRCHVIAVREAMNRCGSGMDSVVVTVLLLPLRCHIAREREAIEPVWLWNGKRGGDLCLPVAASTHSRGCALVSCCVKAMSRTV